MGSWKRWGRSQFQAWRFDCRVPVRPSMSAAYARVFTKRPHVQGWFGIRTYLHEKNNRTAAPTWSSVYIFLALFRWARRFVKQQLAQDGRDRCRWTHCSCQLGFLLILNQSMNTNCQNECSICSTSQCFHALFPIGSWSFVTRAIFEKWWAWALLLRLDFVTRILLLIIKYIEWDTKRWEPSQNNGRL